MLRLGKEVCVDELVSRVMDVAELVGYQEGSVISRALIDKAVGTVTLFAFDQGQGLSEHTAPYDAMVVAVEGKVEITIAGKPHVVKAGQMLIMPAQQPHSLRALTPCKMLLVMIRS